MNMKFKDTKLQDLNFDRYALLNMFDSHNTDESVQTEEQWRAITGYKVVLVDMNNMAFVDDFDCLANLTWKEALNLPRMTVSSVDDAPVLVNGTLAKFWADYDTYDNGSDLYITYNGRYIDYLNQDGDPVHALASDYIIHQLAFDEDFWQVVYVVGDPTT